jgi:uncharacterized protein YndB with AHSA1/START domain
MIPAIQATLTVGVPVERAFRVFTESLNTWWPAEYHIGSAATDAAILEPREGGRWYERGVDGSECDWSRVLAWQPPHCLVVTWQINGLWQFDPKPDHASEIEVHFRADGPELTTVELEPPALGPACRRLGQAIHETLISGGSWIAMLELFAKAATNTE